MEGLASVIELEQLYKLYLVIKPGKQIKDCMQ